MTSLGYVIEHYLLMDNTKCETAISDFGKGNSFGAVVARSTPTGLVARESDPD